MLREKSVLFSPLRLGGVVVSNRFIRSATYEGLCDSSGFALDGLHSLIADLASGGCGIIITGFGYASKRGQCFQRQLGLHTYDHCSSWRPLLSYVHSTTPSKVVFQVCHAGPKGPERLSPSSFDNETREMSVGEIESTIASFVDCAANLKKAGADGIQLHCAHGFLLSCFLSPTKNRRRDEFGGSPENRIRIVKEIAQQIRKVTGPDFIISAKLNGDDYDDAGGVTPTLCGWYISQLPMIDLFEISAGAVNKAYASRLRFDRELFLKYITPQKEALRAVTAAQAASQDVPFFEAYNLDKTEAIRRIVPNAKLAIVGGLRKFDTMDQIVSQGTADMVSLSRPFIRQPHLVNELKNGNEDSKCISCGLCLYGNKGYRCYFP